jgi:aspartate racemase
MMNFFAVIGGMGTSATESYIRLVNKFTHAHNDQEFLDYIVFNHASVPDRTAHIIDPVHAADPTPLLKEDIRQATVLGARFITLPCNTAHYDFDELQACTDVPILHMPQITVAALSQTYPANAYRRVGLLATRGSVLSGVYKAPVTDAGYEFIIPDEELQTDIDALIYHDVKETGDLDDGRYRAVLTAMLERMHCDTVILGCTELSVLAEAFPHPELPIVDAQFELAKKTVELGKELQTTNTY